MAGRPIIDSARIIKKIRFKAFYATLQTMINASEKVIANVADNIRFRNVTGNAYTSISAGVYYKGKLFHIATIASTHDEPTRRTLRKGERYNLPYFYDEFNYGSGASQKSHRFVGKYGRGGQWGPSLGPYYLKRQHPNQRKTWEIVVTIPVSYAGYVPGIVATAQQMMDDLPNCVQDSIVRVETAPDGETNG